jgi:hypothetical protein
VDEILLDFYGPMWKEGGKTAKIAINARRPAAALSIHAAGH